MFFKICLENERINVYKSEPVIISKLFASSTDSAELDVGDPLDLMLVCSWSEEDEGNWLVTRHLVKVSQRFFEHLRQVARKE